MCGIIGQRMERALKKEEEGGVQGGVGLMNNQTVRQEDDSPGVEDDEMDVEDDEDFFKPKIND